MTVYANTTHCAFFHIRIVT